MPDIDYVSSKPLPENLSDIADSLRSKTGISGEIHTDEMAGIIDTLGSPLPLLTNPASTSDILDGKEVILPDANDEPIVVTGTLVPDRLSSEFVEVQKSTVTVASNNVSNVVSLKEYLAGLAGFNSSAVFAFAIHPKVTYNYNNIGLAYYDSVRGDANGRLIVYRYRKGWGSIPFSSFYDAIADVGDIYDVYCVTPNWRY